MERIRVSQITVDQRFLASVDLRMLVYMSSPFPHVGEYARFALASWHHPSCSFPFSLASAHECWCRSQGLEGDLHNYLFRQWLYSHTASGPRYQSSVGALFDSRHLLMMKGVEERRVAGSLVPLRPFPLGPNAHPFRRQPSRTRR